MKKSITVKSIVSIVTLLVVFAVIVNLAGNRAFSEAIRMQYSEDAFRIAAAAAMEIDGDRMDEYFEKGEDWEEYRTIWNRMDELCNAMGATFIYVIRPDLTDYGSISFVFSTVNHDSVYSPYPVGYIRQTPNDEYRQKYRNLYEDVSEQELIYLESSNYSVAEHHLTAMIPLKGADGSTRAILCVQRQMSALAITRQVFRKSILQVLGVLTVVAGITHGIYLSRVLIRPIRKITDEAARFASENRPAEKKLTQEIRNQDEIGVLAESIDQMEEQIGQYIENITAITAEKQRITTELDLAKRIQMSMIPHDFPPFPDRKEFALYATVTPARGVGGDFYDYFLIDEDHLCLVMADVSGKGIPGALFMMVSKVILQSCAMLGRSAAEILDKTNEALCSNNQAEMFVTAWLGILEISTGKLTAANAGHEYPAIMYPDGAFALYRDRHGLVIGGMEDIKYREYELQLKPGTKLFLYTDGLPEAADADNRMFGTGRMLDALNSAKDGDPEAVLAAVQNAVNDFVQSAEQFDDLTMLCLEYRGEQDHRDNGSDRLEEKEQEGVKT